MARVSVVIPAYNKKDFIVDALDSVFAQSYRDFEVIVVDDGSTDGTALQVFSSYGAQPKAIEELTRMSPTSVRTFTHLFVHDAVQVWYHYNQNRGLAAARNRGIRCAHGTHIAFLEAEDLWDSMHLATHMSFHDESDTPVISHTGARHLKERGRPRKSRKEAPPTGYIFEHALDTSPIGISAALAHRACFAECGYFDENMPACEDYDLWLRMSARFPICYLDGPEVIQRHARVHSARAWSWDRYRVYALEKSFQGGKLDPVQRFLVAKEIVRKCERLVDGFQNLKSEERANFYDRKRKRFALEVRKLRASYLAGPGAPADEFQSTDERDTPTHA
jgi:glycosyltransferase involved in cell wall biosynthesis